MADGDVEIVLSGKEVTLQPTLEAAIEINAKLGNFAEAWRRLAAFDLQAYSIIVAAGLGKKPSDVQGRVFKAGLHRLTEPLSKFVSNLANGGKELPDDDEAEGESSPGEA